MMVWSMSTTEWLQGSDDSFFFETIQFRLKISYVFHFPINKETHVISSIFTGRNEVVAKVMFLQVCVCPRGEGVCLSACWDARPNPPPRPREKPPGPGRAPRTRQTPPGPGRPPRTRQTPLGSRLQNTVYERPVRILLECILVFQTLPLRFIAFCFHFRVMQCAKWVKADRLPRWLPTDQQVLHQRWIWGICCMQAKKHSMKQRANVTSSLKLGYQCPHYRNHWCP